MSSSDTAPGAPRRADRLAGWLATGFIVVLLGSEGALTLPSETASASAVVDFYVRHRGFIVGLQLVGLVASALLAAYAWRLRRVDRPVSAAGVLVAVASIAPGAFTALLAIRASASHLDAADRLNRLEPRGDDILFAAVTLFAAVIAVRWRRSLPWTAAWAALVAVASGARLALEAAGHARGPLETAAPLAFVGLMAVLAVLSFRGVLAPPAVSIRGARHQ